MRLHLWLAIPALALGCTTCVAVPIFRCPQLPGYQDLPCDESGSRLDPKAFQPAEHELRAAQATARRERKFVARVEAERERAHRAADAERARRAARRAERDERCARYQRTIDYAEEDLAEDSRRKRRARKLERELREARDRHFSECLAAR